MELLVINGSRWDDENYYHRLGFYQEVRDVNKIKEHYRILAKHYHPDNPNAPPNATAAFQNIKEAYEHLLANAKETKSETHKEPFSGFHFSDHFRRKAQMRFLGDGVALFMAMTIIFIYIVARHNKDRLKARHLWDLLLIFFIIQLFPRLLAAAILYACHTNYLVSLAEAKEQAATSLIVERRQGDELFISLDGIAADVKENIVMQVTLTTTAAAAAPSSSSSSSSSLLNKEEPVASNILTLLKAAERKNNLDNPTLTSTPISTTLTFDSGVTSVSLPVGSSAELTEYRVKAVDTSRGFVVADHTLRV